MTVKEIAKREGISERQAQRYCRVGYRGHVLPTTRNGKGFVIAEADYRAWRIVCGFEEAQPQVSAPAPSTNLVERPAPASPEHQARRRASYPPWPQPADPNGQLTNVPHEHSRNWPHPEACRIHAEEELRKQRGYADDEN